MPVADTLLRLAEPPALYEARWTEEILAEVTRTLIVRFGKSREKALYRQRAIQEFFPHSMVVDYQPLVAQMRNHPKDRHVLAAAVACRADYLVTFNLKDFVSPSPDTHAVTAIGPSSFLKLLASRERSVVEERLHQQASAIGISMNDLLDRLAGAVPGFVSVLRER
jgi:predicted nucleic acid-binding protein